MNRPNGRARKKKTYTHGVLASDEKLSALEDLLLQSEYDNGPVDAEDGEDHDQNMEDPEE